MKKLLPIFLLFGILNIGLNAVAQDDNRKDKGRTKKNKKTEVKPNLPAEPTKDKPNSTYKPPAAPVVTGFITGVIQDEDSKEPIIGAYLTVEGTVSGTISDDNGKFSIPYSANGVVNLVINYIGYERKVYPVSANKTNLIITLKEQLVMTQEVVVTASRVSERILESPVTIEKLDLRMIRENPSINTYDAVASMKGVDQMSASMGFRVINTRGFNSMTNPRFVHRVDGMDLQAPGLNIPLNVLNGTTDLDAESIELIPGAASALYGPNVFNGLMDVTTKNPFRYKGLSVSFKAGANHLDGKDHAVAPLYDFGFRYGWNHKDKFAAKINFSYFKATDWYATDYTDDTKYAGSDNLAQYPKEPGNPGYSGINLYGDEVNNLFTPRDSLGAFQLLDKNLLVARTGYKESDLADYNTYNLKGDVGFYYRLKNSAEISFTSRFAMGTTVYQSVNRYSIKDFLTHVHKLELKGKNYFVRAYVSTENAGNSYDTRFAGINMNNYYKNHQSWLFQYLLAYSPTTNFLLNNFLPSVGRGPIRPGNEEDARKFAESDNKALYPFVFETVKSLLGADSLTASGLAKTMTGGNARLQPGTPEFEAAKKAIIDNPNLDNGAKFIDETRFYHVEGQYDFTPHIHFAEVLAGANYRLYALNSQGTIFVDTLGKNILVHEAGAFVQATKRFINRKLRVTASFRGDKNQNFDFVFSPRVAVVYTFGENRQHNIRTSFQTGFRMPTLQNQYLDLDIGGIKYIAGLDDALDPYRLRLKDNEGKTVNNTYDETSVQKFLISGDSSQLVRADIARIKPELTRCFELGYKGNISDVLVLDISAYMNYYKDFLSVQAVLGPNLANKGKDKTDALSLDDLKTKNYVSYRRPVNYLDDVYTFGISIGAQLSLGSKFSLFGNYTYAKMLSDKFGRGTYIVGFNTPSHKTNLTFAGRNIIKNVGFAITHRWIDAMKFEETVIAGILPAYNLVDAQISYRVPKVKTTFKLGATNLLNNRHQESLVGPVIGAVAYFQFTFDELLN